MDKGAFLLVNKNAIKSGKNAHITLIGHFFKRPYVVKYAKWHFFDQTWAFFRSGDLASLFECTSVGGRESKVSHNNNNNKNNTFRVMTRLLRSPFTGIKNAELFKLKIDDGNKKDFRPLPLISKFDEVFFFHFREDGFGGESSLCTFNKEEECRFGYFGSPL